MATFTEKVKKAIQRPNLLRIRLYDFLFGKLKLFQKEYQWRSMGQEIGRRVYKDYSEYVAHQKGKLSTMDLSDYDEKYYHILKDRLKPLAARGVIKKGNIALCLAARIGTEVRAFLDFGCFAVGIDLNPGKENKYVLTGDFHNIQFPECSVDIVFSNSFDHALYLEKLVREVKRVLKPKGHLVLEIVRGFEEGGKVGYYEASAWPKIDDCLQYFLQAGFAVVERNNFDYPWGGQQVVLKNDVRN